MLDDAELHALGDSLLRIGRQAFDGGHYEVAYHALMGALHCASDEADPACVRRVEALANEQRDWIDRHAPAHRLSTFSAAARGHAGIYHNLVRQASATRQLIEQRVEWGMPARPSGSADQETE